MVLNGKTSQEYPFKAGGCCGSILDLTFFLLYINGLPNNVICNIAIYADIILSTLSVFRDLICGNNLNWLLTLNLVYETLQWGSSLLVSMLEKLFSFGQSNNIGDIDVKMVGSVLEKKSSFKMLELTFSSKLDWGSYIISIAKTASKKIVALICSYASLYLINLPNGHVWNTVISGLAILVAIWNC